MSLGSTILSFVELCAAAKPRDCSRSRTTSRREQRIARIGPLLVASLILQPVSADTTISGGEPTFPEYAVADQRDRAGLWRDTKYFLGYQVAVIGMLYVMPESVSGWSEEQKEEYDLDVWWDNVTHPENDSDDFFINYVLHPYWGAAYFVRARERGYSGWEGFAYSTLMSSLYEFGVEALFEEASRQDLWVTPVIGSLVGSYFWHLRGNIRERDFERGYRSTGDKWLWVLTDPLGSMNRQVDRWLGRETRLKFAPFRQYDTTPGTTHQRRDVAVQDTVIGVQFEIQW